MAFSLFKRRTDPEKALLQQELAAERAAREKAEAEFLTIARAAIKEPFAAPPSPTLPPQRGLNLYAFDQPYRYSFPHAPIRKPESNIDTRQLRQLAQTTDIVRSAIQHLKREQDAVPIKITAKDEKDKARSIKTGIREASEFFSIPGGLGGRGSRRQHFERKMADDILVIGATATWYRPTRGGKPYEVHAVDAATIRPRVDAYGWPGPTDYVYEQWIYGVQVAEFTREELRYDGLDPNTTSPYFFSATEWAILPITNLVTEDDWNRKWLTEGTMPSDIWELPDTWTPEQAKDYIQYFEAMMAGDNTNRQRMKFIPGKVMRPAAYSRKEHDFQSWEDWNLHRVCSIFGVQPSSLGYPGKAYKVAQDESYDQTSEFGVGQLLEFRKATYDDLLVRLGYDDLECQNVTAQEEKALERANRNSKLVLAGIKTINEAREEEGAEPVEDGDTVLVPNTMTTLDAVLNPAPEAGMDGADGQKGEESPTNGKMSPGNTASQEDGAAAGGDNRRPVRPQRSFDGEADAESEAVPPRRAAREQDLALWSKKALRRLKAGRGAFCRFESDAIPHGTAEIIELGLLEAADAEAVRRVFRWAMEDPVTGE